MLDQALLGIKLPLAKVLLGPKCHYLFFFGFHNYVN